MWPTSDLHFLGDLPPGKVGQFWATRVCNVQYVRLPPITKKKKSQKIPPEKGGKGEELKVNKMVFSTPFPAGMHPRRPNQACLHRQRLHIRPRNPTHLHVIIVLLPPLLPIIHPTPPTIQLHPPPPHYPHPPRILRRRRIRSRSLSLSSKGSRHVCPRYDDILRGQYEASSSVPVTAVEFDYPGYGEYTEYGAADAQKDD